MVLYKRNMFAEAVACELQRQLGVEEAFSIRSIEHLYDNRVKVEYILLKEIGRDEEATIRTERLYMSPNIILSEYKERCESLKEKIENLENENIKLKEEYNDLLREN